MDSIKRLLFTPIGELGRAPRAMTAAVQRRPERRFPRYKVPVPVIARSGRRELTGITATMGMGGLFIACQGEPFPTHTPVTLTLVPNRRNPHMGITARGQVVYMEAGGMGVRFSGLTPDQAQRIKTLFLSATSRG